MADEVIATIEKSLSLFDADGTDSQGLDAVLSFFDWRTGDTIRALGAKRSTGNETVLAATQYTYNEGSKKYQANEFGYTKCYGTSQYQVVVQDEDTGNNFAFGISPDDDLCMLSFDDNPDDAHNIRIGKQSLQDPTNDLTKNSIVSLGPLSLYEVTGNVVDSPVVGAQAGYQLTDLIKGYLYGNKSAYQATINGSVGLSGYESGMSGTITDGVASGRESAKSATLTEFTGIGNYALKGASCSGIDSFGYESGLNNTGDSSGFFCARAGKNNTGSACLFLGRGTGEDNTQSNQLLIGHGITGVGSSNIVVIGKIGDHDNTLLPGVSRSSGGSISGLTSPAPLYITDKGEIFANESA